MNKIIDTLINAKWEDALPTIPSNFVDLIVTSPPYNVDLGSNKLKKDSYEEYDDGIPYEEYLGCMTRFFIECNRVLKSGGRMAINIGDKANGQIPTHSDFTQIILNLHETWNTYARLYKHINKDDIKKFQMMTTIVWHKKQIGSVTSWGSWQSPSQPSFPTPFEFILVFAKETLKHEGEKEKITVTKENFMRNSRALWEFPPETRMIELYGHPACFPEELPRRLIDQLTYEDDVVLDAFSGVGTTCAVAKQMNRRYIGIEMSKKYHDVAMERLNFIPFIKKMIIDGKKVDMPDWLT